MKKALAALAILVFAGLLFYGLYYLVGGIGVPPPTDVATTSPIVISFEDCAALYPVMESFPRQCRTPDGRLFAEEPQQVLPTYTNASSNDIQVDNPSPGAVTGKSFTVTGTARGPWYFEASFPIDVLDGSGSVLTTGIATAEGEWMTTEFVSFSAPVTVPATYIGPATLVLRNDNPSGLPENARSVSFPITIEY